MTNATPTHPGQPLPRLFETGRKIPAFAWIVVAALIAYAVASVLVLRAEEGTAAVVRFRFDFTPMLKASPTIQIHAAAATASFLLGLGILFLPKGTGLHKPLGWTWVGLMTVTAVSSLFIQAIFQNSFSPIHALSAWVLISLPMGIAAVRRRNIKAHRKHMAGMFLGGMLIAGLFTFLPGRLMWDLFFTV
jgi:uncharacterized membrane protein